MALTKDRDTPRRDGVDFSAPLAAATVMHAGSIFCINAAGYGTPGATATTLKAVGVTQARADNSGGSAGAVSGTYRKGVFRFKNSASGDLIALADVNADCYVVDDETVAKTNGSNTRSVAGKIVDVDADGVWVRIG